MNALWLSKADTLTLLGRSSEYFRTAIQPHLADEHAQRCDGRGKPWRFYAPAVVAIALEGVESATDPLLTGGDSPGLERYRLAKAALAELDLANRKGELIDVGKCKDMLSRWATIIRRMGERLGKRFGNDASEAVNDSLDECRAAIRALDANEKNNA